jgi:Mg2+-importing ATPase
MGFVNEYKAAKTAEALHSSVRHSCVALRDGHPRTVDVTELVPGDVVDLQLGQVVPADLRLLAVAGLECDESVLTGESVPAEKSAEPARRRECSECFRCLMVCARDGSRSSTSR